MCKGLEQVPYIERILSIPIGGEVVEDEKYDSISGFLIPIKSRPRLLRDVIEEER
jgi:hypothetical protein